MDMHGTLAHARTKVGRTTSEGSRLPLRLVRLIKPVRILFIEQIDSDGQALGVDQLFELSFGMDTTFPYEVQEIRMPLEPNYMNDGSGERHKSRISCDCGTVAMTI
jgi:hypothetical protein